MTHLQAAPIVITGRGMITPLGSGTGRNFDRMCQGESGTIPGPGTQLGREGQHFGRIPKPDWEALRAMRGLRRQDRAVALAVSAAHEAMAEAGLASDEHGLQAPRVDPTRIALCVGTSTGPATMLFEAAAAFGAGGEAQLKRTQPLAAVHGAQASIAGEVARRFGIAGPSMTMNAECASGNTVIAIGSMLLRSGAADAVLCCAVDSSIHPAYISQANLIGALAGGACRPFDERRDGFVMSEGGAAVVLERVSTHNGQAVSSPAGYGVIRSVGMSTDTSHATAPAADGEPLVRALRHALRDSGLAPGQIDVISSHGTGTPRNDPSELTALDVVFGAHLAGLPVHAVKSTIGHTLAAAGLIELIILSCTLQAGVIPPIIGCARPLPTPARLVRDKPLRGDLHHGLSTSCGFGGNNTALVLSRAPSIEN